MGSNEGGAGKRSVVALGLVEVAVDDAESGRPGGEVGERLERGGSDVAGRERPADQAERGRF